MDWAFGMFHQLYKSQISKVHPIALIVNRFGIWLLKWVGQALAKAQEKAGGEVKKDPNEGSLHLAKVCDCSLLLLSTGQVLAVFNKKLPAQLFKEEWVRTLNQPEVPRLRSLNCTVQQLKLLAGGQGLLLSSLYFV